MTLRQACRHRKMPRVGQTVEWATGPVTVLAVHDRGRWLVVRDAIGREHDAYRADAGYWTVTP